MTCPVFWVLSEVDSHLTVPHPENGLPTVLVFSGKGLIDQFNLDNPQPNTIAKGVFRDDIKLMLRQWVYGGVEYFVLDPGGSRPSWNPRPVSAFQDLLPSLLEENARLLAEATVEGSERAVEEKARALAEFQDDLHAQLFPRPAETPAPPPPAKPWYEAYGLD